MYTGNTQESAGNFAAVDDDAILDGSQDADLKFFAQGAAKYSGQIVLALNEEVDRNYNRSGTARGNTRL